MSRKWCLNSVWLIKAIVILVLIVAADAHAVTIYIDATLAADCTSGNYSIANRTCTGSDGNAYNDIAAAHANGSGGANIFYLRAGSHTSNMAGTGGITATAHGQTWATYPGDLPTRAHLTGGALHTFVFDIQGWDTFTIKDLHISGGLGHGVKMQNSDNSVVQDVEMSNFSTNSLYGDDGSGGYNHGFNFGAHSSLRQDNLIVRRVHVHSPASRGANQGCIVGGSDNTSGWILEDNIVEDCSYGIWFDVGGGNVAAGNTAFIVRRTLAKDIVKACYHIEARSSATFINNIGINCDEGFRMRPGNDLMSHVRFQNNTLYNFTMIGIWVQNDQALADTANINIDNNILYSSVNSHAGLSVGTSHLAEATNTYRNNVFHLVNSAVGICWGDNIETSPACEGTTYADSGAGITSWQAACATCTGNVSGDPLFTNAGSEDFTLQAGSSAINVGLTIGTITTDFAGTTRPQGAAYEIGAYEFTESSGGGGRRRLSAVTDLNGQLVLQ
jgi:parallel beta-helix repeat protein